MQTMEWGWYYDNITEVSITIAGITFGQTTSQGKIGYAHPMG